MLYMSIKEGAPSARLLLLIIGFERLVLLEHVWLRLHNTRCEYVCTA